MDDTMSSYSFSHQFYQRWTCAPEPIRAAIIQELKDISALLQNDTPFESFVFNTHDLDTYVDEFYENHKAEQAIAKAVADKNAQEQAAAENQRLEEQKKQAAEDTKRKEIAKLEEARLYAEAETAQKKQEQEAQLASEKNNGDKAGNKIKAINDKASTAISLAVKDTKLSAAHQELIRDLEIQIDDYLSEQMLLMSENLKSWLRAEMTQHLNEQGTSAANEDVAKKNVH